MAAPQPSATPTADLEILTTAAGRKALAAFFLCGILMAFLGAILPAWGFHRHSHFGEAGLYFLALNAGLIFSTRTARQILGRWSVKVVLVGGCLGAAAGLFAMSAPMPEAWKPLLRFGSLVVVGFFAGLLNSAVLYAITPLYQQDRAATLNLAGMLFGSGCLVTALIVGMTINAYSPGAIVFWMALVPLFAAGFYARGKFPKTPVVANLKMDQRRPLKEVAVDMRSPATVLFALLVFVQFGNEWALAGWLPMMMIQRLGISPFSALMLLALYWLCLVTGRSVAQALLPRFRHNRLLMGSVLAALFGCLVLGMTNNLFGATVGIAFAGGGFAMIYPLVIEQVGDRFPYYHPAFFNGLFSLAMTGGMLAPTSVGYLAQQWGAGAAILIPLIGTLVVFFLLVLIRLESKLARA